MEYNDIYQHEPAPHQGLVDMSDLNWDECGAVETP